MLTMLFQPRDQYLSKLLSKVQFSDKDTVQTAEDISEDTVDSWENLDDETEQVGL